MLFKLDISNGFKGLLYRFLTSIGCIICFLFAYYIGEDGI